MKKLNQKRFLQFQKTKIARLNENELQSIIGGNDDNDNDPKSVNVDTSGICVITSSLSCIISFTTGG